jgi:predicted PurR-regulated permease PerM
MTKTAVLMQNQLVCSLMGSRLSSSTSTISFPLLVDFRGSIGPVLVIISLVFWFWMWGIPGAILSMPMLAIIKIICDRLQPLAAFGHFLEG